MRVTCIRKSEITKYYVISAAAGLTGAMGIPGTPALQMSGTNPSQQAQYLETAQAAAAASGDQSFVQIQGETKKRKRSKRKNLL